MDKRSETDLFDNSLFNNSVKQQLQLELNQLHEKGTATILNYSSDTCMGYQQLKIILHSRRSTRIICARFTDSLNNLWRLPTSA